MHLKASLVLAASFSTAAMITQDVRLLECVGGALVGILVSPDLDVDKGNISNLIVRRKVGVFAEKLWRGFWRGYSGSFKHRGFASHFPIFSTFVRLSYAYYLTIFIPHILIYFLFSPQWSLMYVLTWYANIIFSPMFVYGLISSDTIHFFLDVLAKEKYEFNQPKTRLSTRGRNSLRVGG